MVYGLWQSAGGMQAQMHKQAILAHNLANVETPAFKPDRIAFTDRLNAATARHARGASHGVLDALSGGVFETQTYTDYTEGPVSKTSSPLDVSIRHDGFLAVRTKDGVRYTRDGALLIDSEGTLVHAATGGAVLDENGQRIALERNARAPLTIDTAGTVRQGDAVAGRLGLTDFEDRQKLNKVGENLYDGSNAAKTQAHGEFAQFTREESAVDPVMTTVEMIAATRAYELNATMISLADETIGRAVNDVGRPA